MADERTSCATCRAAHGVAGTEQNNTNLINFSIAEVTPNASGSLYFADEGTFRGTCSLSCYGYEHNDTAYPARTGPRTHRPIETLQLPPSTW